MDSANQKQASSVFAGCQSGYDKMTELEVSSARFDQTPGPAEGVRKFVICSTQRSGSFLLCRQLINAGIGIPQEYFNPIHLDLLRRRWKLDPQGGRGYIDELYARRTTPNGVWGIKLQWPQYVAYRPVTDDIFCDVSHYLFLYRTDLAAQAVSLHASFVTGIWGFDGAQTTPVHPDTQAGDIRQVGRCALRIVQENEEWRNFFALRQITPLAISHEDFVADQQGYVRRIAQFLGLDDTAYRFPAPEEREDRFPPEIEALKRDLRTRGRQLLEVSGQMDLAVRHERMF